MRHAPPELGLSMELKFDEHSPCATPRLVAELRAVLGVCLRAPRAAHLVFLVRPGRRAHHARASGPVPGDDDLGLPPAPPRPAAALGGGGEAVRAGRRLVRPRAQRQGAGGRPRGGGRRARLGAAAGHVRRGERRQAARDQAGGVGNVPGVHGQRRRARRHVQRARRGRRRAGAGARAPLLSPALAAAAAARTLGEVELDAVLRAPWYKLSEDGKNAKNANALSGAAAADAGDRPSALRRKPSAFIGRIGTAEALSALAAGAAAGLTEVASEARKSGFPIHARARSRTASPGRARRVRPRRGRGSPSRGSGRRSRSTRRRRGRRRTPPPPPPPRGERFFPARRCLTREVVSKRKRA